MSRFEAKVPTPGGHFKITEDGLTWNAEDEASPPYVWGWPNIDMAELYVRQLYKTIRLAQEARRGE